MPMMTREKTDDGHVTLMLYLWSSPRHLANLRWKQNSGLGEPLVKFSKAVLNSV